jgi:hypothetical protein
VKTPIFSAEFFGENFLENHNIGPRYAHGLHTYITCPIPWGANSDQIWQNFVPTGEPLRTCRYHTMYSLEKGKQRIFTESDKLVVPAYLSRFVAEKN